MQTVDKEAVLNECLVRLYNDITRVEERSLASPETDGLSLKEMHVIDMVHACQQDGTNSPKHIAQRVGVTPGTLTTAVNLLVIKGFLKCTCDEMDRRSKRVVLTEKGLAACRAHGEFHKRMVRAVLADLTCEESDAFVNGLMHVNRFFQDNTEKEF